MTVEIFFLEEEDTPVRRMTPGGWKASTMLEITVRWTRTDRRSFILKKDDNIAIVVRTIIDTVFSFHRERERESVCRIQARTTGTRTRPFEQEPVCQEARCSRGRVFVYIFHSLYIATLPLPSLAKWPSGLRRNVKVRDIPYVVPLSSLAQVRILPSSNFLLYSRLRVLSVSYSFGYTSQLLVLVLHFFHHGVVCPRKKNCCRRSRNLFPVFQAPSRYLHMFRLAGTSDPAPEIQTLSSRAPTRKKTQK